MKELRFKVPDEWHAQLSDAAHTRALSRAALLRQLLRDFLRGRYNDKERETLDG